MPWAYLDPASGSMMLQLVLGGVAGLAVAFKLFWRKLERRFRGSRADARHGADPSVGDPGRPEGPGGV